MTRILACSLAGLIAVGWATVGWTADAVPKDKILAARSFRASKLSGLNVRNNEGEKVGTINDLVVDVATGKVEYAALSVGGVLGIGDKLFAVPFSELKFDHGRDEMYFVLNISKEKLQAAPGFDQSSWPNFADTHWREQIDKYYRETRTKERSRETSKELPRNPAK